jgi:hypothetical protein
MPLQDTPTIMVVSSSAAESLPDPTLVPARTHWLINAFSLPAVYSSIGATPFSINGVLSATVTIPAGAHISVRSDGVRWIVTDGADNFLLALPTVTTPARALNVNFTPHATRPVLGIYSVQVTCTASLLVGQAGRIDLMADNGVPATVRASNRSSLTAGVIVALGDQTIQRVPISFLFPAGWSGRLQSTAEVGAPTFAISAQTEIIL